MIVTLIKNAEERKAASSATQTFRRSFRSLQFSVKSSIAIEFLRFEKKPVVNINEGIMSLFNRMNHGLLLSFIHVSMVYF